MTYADMQSDVERWIIEGVKHNNDDIDALIDDLWQIQGIRYETEHRRQTARPATSLRARLATQAQIQPARHQ